MHLCYLLIFIVITTTDAADIGLETQKGIIYGRQTEYLG